MLVIKNLDSSPDNSDYEIMGEEEENPWPSFCK